jgi:hypothetical protein
MFGFDGWMPRRTRDRTSVRPAMSKRRRSVFFLVMIMATYVITEFVALAGLHSSINGFSTGRLYRTQDSIASGRQASDGAQDVIHPYLGWVHNPQVSEVETVFDIDVPVNRLGFKDFDQTIFKRSQDSFVVGILGGSVAWHVSIAGSETLRKQLQTHPRLVGRRIEFSRMATSGYKQPQQVMALNYVSVLGGEFDAVVNIDGYNEVALAVDTNARMNTSITYPQAWHARSISAIDPRAFAAADQLLRLRAKRQTMATDIAESRFRWSPTANLVWLIRDQAALSQLTDLGIKVSRIRSGSFVNHGPSNDFQSQEEQDQAVIDLWKRSSLQLHRICEANGVIYLHVLQPNQYLTGSKVMNAEEKQHAYDPQQRAAVVISRIYPDLRDTAAWLTDAGVNFSDQSMLFSDIDETIYADKCCHYNKKGNVMLANLVGTELRRLLDEQGEPVASRQH